MIAGGDGLWMIWRRAEDRTARSRLWQATGRRSRRGLGRNAQRRGFDGGFLGCLRVADIPSVLVIGVSDLRFWVIWQTCSTADARIQGGQRGYWLPGDWHAGRMRRGGFWVREVGGT